jgi:hypothetical protein
LQVRHQDVVDLLERQRQARLLGRLAEHLAQRLRAIEQQIESLGAEDEARVIVDAAESVTDSECHELKR